jgi:hypothetical protein
MVCLATAGTAAMHHKKPRPPYRRPLNATDIT